MNASGHIEGLRIVPAGPASLAGILTLLALLLGATIGNAQRADNSRASGAAIPTLEALPHTPLPGRDFLNWCGDRIVQRVDRRLELYDSQVKAFPHSLPGRANLECSNDGHRLVYIDDDCGQVYEADVPDGTATRTVATYEKQLFHAKISFSPDLKNVAATGR